jgi:hypothetical protein
MNFGLIYNYCFFVLVLKKLFFLIPESEFCDFRKKYQQRSKLLSLNSIFGQCNTVLKRGYIIS